jgi:hypothetical protein
MRENRPSGSEGGVALIPPSLPLSNASRPRRCPRSRGSAWSAAACRRCVRWPGWNGVLHRVVAIGLGWKPAFQRDVITTGGSRGTRFSSWRRAGARGKWWLRRRCSCSGSSKGGGTIGVRNGGRKRWAGERWMQAARRIRVRSRGPASFGLGPWRKLCWVWRPSGVPSAGACCARTAAPPRGPKTEMSRRPHASEKKS